jgi:hypothetical protein
MRVTAMARVTISLVIVLVLAVLAGCFYLAFGNFPVAPTRVEKALPDARFPK